MSGAIIPIHNPLQKKLTFKSGLIFDDYRNNMLEHGLIFKQAIINWLRRPASSGSGGVRQPVIYPRCWLPGWLATGH